MGNERRGRAEKAKSKLEGSGSKKEKERSKGSSKLRKVELVFQAPEAQEVFVAGDFNDWDPRALPMKRHKEGFWKTKLRLPAGRYEYKFVADGQWVHYVRGVERVSNPFGTDNLVLWVD